MTPVHSNRLVYAITLGLLAALGRSASTSICLRCHKWPRTCTLKPLPRS